MNFLRFVAFATAVAMAWFFGPIADWLMRNDLMGSSAMPMMGYAVLFGVCLFLTLFLPNKGSNRVSQWWNGYVDNHIAPMFMCENELRVWLEEKKRTQS